MSILFGKIRLSHVSDSASLLESAFHIKKLIRKVRSMKTRSRTLTGLFCMITAMALSGCAPNAVVNPTSFSQMDQQARTSSQKEYVIAPGDMLDIKFMNNPELNELAMPVRPDGRISLQFAPEVKAAGMTPGELTNLLTEKYASELKKPNITVIVRGFADQKAFVDGEVNGPRLIDLKGPTTIMRAITLAGGMRETARLSNVIVIRKDYEGKPMGTMVDLRKVIDGTDFSQDIYLMPYDIVYVPKSNIALVDKFVDEYISRVIPGLGQLNPLTYYNTSAVSSR